MTATDLQKRVEEFKRGLDKPVQGAEPDFGEQLKEAAKRLARGTRAGFIVSAAPPSDETFGEKLAAATKRFAASRMSPRQAREHAEREKTRYRKVTRRKPTKGE